VLAFFPFAMFAGWVVGSPSSLRLLALLAVYLGMMNVLRLDLLTKDITAKILVSYAPLYTTLALIVWFLRTDGGAVSSAQRTGL
jgi:hypothetical protein